MAAKKKVNVDREALAKEIADKQAELYKLINNLDVIDNQRDTTLEKKFLVDFKQFQKDLAPQLLALKEARKVISRLSDEAGIPVSFEELDAFVTYIPKSFKKKYPLHEDFLTNFNDEKGFNFDGFVYGDKDCCGWNVSY